VYILLLCMRYLRTRYLALVCIVSVMLGVATLIVVNSVMNGFSTKLRDRLHQLLSDVVIECAGLEGFANADEKMARILKNPFLADKIAAMTPTMEVFAMIQYVRWQDGQTITRPIHLVGIDPKSRDQAGGFKEHLVNNKKLLEKGVPLEELPQSSFELPSAIKQVAAQRVFAETFRQYEEVQRLQQIRTPGEIAVETMRGLQLLMAGRFVEDDVPAPAPTPGMQEVLIDKKIDVSQVSLPTGAFVGYLLASYRFRDEQKNTVEERFVLNPGSDITLITVGGDRPEPVYRNFAVVDYFRSDMSEYDGNYVYVPLDTLQEMRHMPNRVTSIQIKLKEGCYDNSSKQVKETLEALFTRDGLFINTWEDKQGPLLQAISIEKGILNILLFLIIAVAGFGVLAIFSMIVAEKTRDIGILKALGASNIGVMKIFLGYGLLLAVVGAVLGSSLGIWLTDHINDVEKFLTNVTGQELFDRKIYYFSEIPTDIRPITVALINFGAVLIAVTFSVLPAIKAALLHPVRALRYE
jgi:lipoprotein-releasing system permease protein